MRFSGRLLKAGKFWAVEVRGLHLLPPPFARACFNHFWLRARAEIVLGSGRPEGVARTASANPCVQREIKPHRGPLLRARLVEMAEVESEGCCAVLARRPVGGETGQPPSVIRRRML